jgi:hypothetical protein
MGTEECGDAPASGGRGGWPRPATLSITVFAAPADAGRAATYREAGIDRVLLEVPDKSRDEDAVGRSNNITPLVKS